MNDWLLRVEGEGDAQRTFCHRRKAITTTQLITDIKQRKVCLHSQAVGLDAHQMSLSKRLCPQD